MSIPSAMKKRLAAASDKKRVLHFNSGNKGNGRLHNLFLKPEWEEIRIDAIKAYAPDIVGNFDVLDDLPDDCADAIWAPHAIQRVAVADLDERLGQCRRVLKTGGIFLCTVPDLQSVAKSIWDGKSPTESLQRIGQPVITALDLLYGTFRDAPNQPLMVHRSAFTAPSLGLTLKKSGFYNIEIKRGDDFVLWGLAYKLAEDAPNKEEKVLVNDKFAPRSKVAPSGLTDEINVPPHLWKPLKLNKK